MMSTLTRLGIRYDSSTDGKEIIRILKEAYERGEGYDICFVNWQMPGDMAKNWSGKCGRSLTVIH